MQVSGESTLGVPHFDAELRSLRMTMRFMHNFMPKGKVCFGQRFFP